MESVDTVIETNLCQDCLLKRSFITAGNKESAGWSPTWLKSSFASLVLLSMTVGEVISRLSTARGFLTVTKQTSQKIGYTGNEYSMTEIFHYCLGVIATNAKFGSSISCSLNFNHWHLQEACSTPECLLRNIKAFVAMIHVGHFDIVSVP